MTKDEQAKLRALVDVAIETFDPEASLGEPHEDWVLAHLTALGELVALLDTLQPEDR